jgi:hypothetical protein
MIDTLQQSQLTTDKPALFQVWIDLNFGEGTPEWWWNTPPKPLGDALDEAAKVRAEKWICKVLPEGVNPRPDGRWDNP